MTVESASYISQLDTTLPTAADLISEGDDHLRLTKTVLKTQFPNFGTTAIAASAAEVNYSVGVTSAIQTQLNGKAPTASPTFTGTAVLPATTSIGTVSDVEIATLDGVTSSIQPQINARAVKAGDTYSGTHDFTGAAVTVPTATAGDSTNKAASTAFVTGAVGAVAATQVAAAIHAATSKTTPVDADELGIADSAASWGLKKLTFANLKAWIGGLSGDTINGDLNFSGAGRRITADFSNATAANRLMFQTSLVNGGSVLGLLPNGTAGSGHFRAYSNSDPTNASFVSINSNGVTDVRVNSDREGAGSYLPMAFHTGGFERLRIDTSGNVLVTGGGGLGYGAGSGGTVIQTGSRTSGVALNKPSGHITLVSAAGSGTWQSFTVTNSRVASTDTPVVVQVSGTNWYVISVTEVATGSFRISFQTTGGASIDQPVFKFEILKGATS